MPREIADAVMMFTEYQASAPENLLFDGGR